MIAPFFYKYIKTTKLNEQHRRDEKYILRIFELTGRKRKKVTLNNSF